MIYAIENNTLVTTPTGHLGNVRVTRRERKLIDSGVQTVVRVLGTDGVMRNHTLDGLIEVIDTEEEGE